MHSRVDIIISEAIQFSLPIFQKKSAKQPVLYLRNCFMGKRRFFLFSNLIFVGRILNKQITDPIFFAGLVDVSWPKQEVSTC